MLDRQLLLSLRPPNGGIDEGFEIAEEAPDRDGDGLDRTDPVTEPVNGLVAFAGGDELGNCAQGRVELVRTNYHRMARVMTSRRKRYPAKADLGARWRGTLGLGFMARVSLVGTSAANATVPDRALGCHGREAHPGSE